MAITSHRVITETRICPLALCPVSTNGKKYPSHIAYRLEHSTDDAKWMNWSTHGESDSSAKQPGQRVRSIDAVTTDSRYPWHNQFANIYRDHCVYIGDDETGYYRRKSRVVQVDGFMLDFDSHSASDMPLSQIAAILESAAFQDAVPCSRIVMTGNGYQVHFSAPQSIEGDEDARRQQIAQYEAQIQSAMTYFAETWKLAPDELCKDITRLHRHYPSYNTKKMATFDDHANRIPVQEVLNRAVPLETAQAFVKQMCEQFPAAAVSNKQPPIFRDKTSDGIDDKLRAALEPPCISKLWNDGAPQGRRNACRFPLLARFYKVGLSQDEAINALLEFNVRCTPQDDVVTIGQHVTHFYSDPKTVGCTYMRDTCGVCDFRDKSLDEAKRSCPFHKKIQEAPHHPYYLSQLGNIMRTEYHSNGKGQIEVSHEPVTEVGHLLVKTVIRDGEETLYRGVIASGDWHKSFELPASLWANRTKFAEAIKGLGGDKIIFTSRNIEHMAMASEYLCPNKDVKRVTDFGWNQDYTSYYGVTCVIDHNGIHPPTQEYFRCQHKLGRKLGLAIPESDEQVTKTLIHIRDDLMRFNNYEIMQYVLGVVFSAPFSSLLRERASTTNAVPSIIIKGITGGGKTASLTLAACFFGEVRDSDLISFSSTPRVVNDLGYIFRDALYVIDDLKWSSLNAHVQSQIVQVLQAYVDGHGRNRLSNRGGGEWEPDNGKEIRGTVCVAAEDLPSGEASVFGRYMIVSLDHSESDTERYARCLTESKHYSAVMASFLLWYLSKGTPHEEMLQTFDRYRRQFEQGVPRDRVNTIRVCTQLALNMVGYQLFLSFATTKGAFSRQDANGLCHAHEDRLRVLRDYRLAQISGETACEKFLTMIASLVASGRAKLDDGKDEHGKIIIGFQEFDPEIRQDVLYLDPQISYGQVQRAYADLNERIPFNQHSLGQQLKTQGYLVRHDADRLTLTKKRNGKKGRYYAIDLAKFEWNTQEEDGLDEPIKPAEPTLWVPHDNGNPSLPADDESGLEPLSTDIGP